jgi:hypothetical protein
LRNSSAGVIIDLVKRKPRFKAGDYLISFHRTSPLRHETAPKWRLLKTAWYELLRPHHGPAQI